MCLAVRELCVQPGGEHAELLMFPLVAIDYPPSWGRLWNASTHCRTQGVDT